MQAAMGRVAFLLAWMLTLLLCGAGGSAARGADDASEAERGRFFQTRIAPLLTKHCVECHGPRAKKGRLDLSHREAALAGGESGEALVPGKADESLLWHYVESDEMPQSRKPLSTEEKRVLRQWIDAGAVWPADPSASAAPSDVWLRRLTVPEYIETVRSAVGVEIEDEARRLSPPDLRADGFSNTAYSLGVDLAHVEAYARLAETIVARMDVVAFASQFSQRRDLNDAAMRELIPRMGKWLLRGPLEEQEEEAYLRLTRAVAEAGGDYREAVSYLVDAMLQSPRFIYRIERREGETAGDYELASRLSYILWGGPPDQELLRAADAGELSDRRRVTAQVERMLQDPRAVARSLQFISEWMDLDRLPNLRPDPDRFPTWSNSLAADMREETLAFFRHVAWEEKRPLADLLNAQATFATPRLAEHYGIDPRHAASEEGRRRASAPQRVESGLQALYTFDETGGDAVRDVSGAGEPIHLAIADAKAVEWGRDGLAVKAPTLIAAASPPSRLIDALKKSKAVTIEAWITPANASQAGPARIVTLSANQNERSFTLGQDGDKYDVRFRTTKTNANGHPSLPSPGGSVKSQPTHVVYTREASGKAKLYLDGEEKASLEVGGDLANWDGGYRLALANELSRDRPWQGTLHLVAIYDRALSSADVKKNHGAGPRAEGLPEPAVGSFAINNRKDLEVLYRFDEAGGETVRDTAGAGEPLNLKIENASAVRWDDKGMTVTAPTLIAAAAPPKRLIDAVKKSKAVTLEAWVTPADAQQSGPARILTLSSGVLQRNFTLGQEADKYDVRFRGSNTDNSGIPSLSSPSGAVAARPTHVVYTRDASGKARLYLNGEEQGDRDVKGDLSNWDNAFRLALANETSGDRPWRGTYHLVAIYSRALPPEEIRANSQIRAAGADLVRYDVSSVPGRGGLLTQGTVLTIGGDEASMVTRGLFVLHELLYSGVDDPPPCVDTTPVPTKPGLTKRAVAEGRIANQACGGCHAKFEPLAFGLEKFDGVGAFHEADEHGNKLREDGEILFPEEDRPISYKTAAELMDLLAGSDRVQRAITRKVTQFAIGRPLAETDEPVLEKIHQTAQDGGGTYASLISAVVMSDLVQTASSTPAAESAPPKVASKPQRVADGVLALYTFDEGKGDRVRDRSGAGEPLDLKIADASATRWSGEGLGVESSTLIATERSAKRLTEALKKTKAVTLEAWIAPTDRNQTGPARIVTLSSGTGQRNFTLGQDGDKIDVRLRTTKTDGNGLPSLAGPKGSLPTKVTHVVYTRDAAGKTKLYIDGKEASSGDAGGDLSNWDGDFRLALANETTIDRAWRGTLHRVAVYDRALTAEEVRQNHGAGL